MGILLSRIANLIIATFVIMLLFLLVCSKSGVTLEMRENKGISTEVIDSIRRDLGISACQAIELLDFEATPPKGGWNGIEIATILKSTDDKFQLVEISREPESTHSHRWSVSSVSILLIDGGGETLVFEREYDSRPNTKDIDDFKKWRNEWWR